MVNEDKEEDDANDSGIAVIHIIIKPTNTIIGIPSFIIDTIDL
jgi:hypothetical protein